MNVFDAKSIRPFVWGTVVGATVTISCVSIWILIYRITFIFKGDQACRPYEIGQKFREQYVDKMYGKYVNAQYLYYYDIDIIGNFKKQIFIIDNNISDVEYGFLRLDESIANFWLVRPGILQIERYNNKYYFVTLKKRFSLTLERHYIKQSSDPRSIRRNRTKE